MIKKEEKRKSVFTTGDISKICKVAPRTVCKWFDSGRLKGYKIPGSQDRRIPREWFIKFLKEHGMPLGEFEDETTAKVLIVTQDQVLIEAMKRELPLERSFKVAIAENSFAAGVVLGAFKPDAVVVDYSIGIENAMWVCNRVRKSTELFVILLSDDNSISLFAHETFAKPFDSKLLAERLRSLIGTKKELV